MKPGNIDKQLKVPTFQRKTDLNEYLDSPENVEIDRILRDYNAPEDERLDYFNYLYFQLQIILANLDNPTIIVFYLSNLYPENDEAAKIDTAFLLENLHVLLTFSPEYRDPVHKKKMDIMLDMIDDEIYRLLEELDPGTYGDGVARNFRRMVAYSDTSDDPKKAIDGLISRKAGLQQNAVLYGNSSEITKTIRLIDIEIRRLRLTHNIPFPIENKQSEVVQEEIAISGDQTEKKPDHSALLEELSAYITGISAPEFTNIIEHHQMTPGTPKAQWIGRPADAHRFATHLNMPLPVFNKCFSLSIGRELRHNDKNETGARIIDILKVHFPK